MVVFPLVHLWGFDVSFYIDKKKFTCKKNIKNEFYIKSVPFDYKVKILTTSIVNKKFMENKNNIFLIDSYIEKEYFTKLRNRFPVFSIEANENNKNIETALDIINFFDSKKVTKLNKVIVIGGGILQDLGAFACSMYKRGIPWVYLPTTLLGMTDSCVGGKTGLNYQNKKNILALFSAPREVIIDLTFLTTLSHRDYLSGLGEALRLHITGGIEFVERFEKNIEAAIKKNRRAIKDIILNSLIIKKAVVEEDEFEINIRRSMNYGHSIGHALETLSNFSFPHGMAVSIGICIENLLASSHYNLDEKICFRLQSIAQKLIDREAKESLKYINHKNFADVLKSDKKTIGSILKLAIPEDYGKISFKNFDLNAKSNIKIAQAINKIL